MEKKIIVLGATSKTAEAIIKLLNSETNYELFLVSSQNSLLYSKRNTNIFTDYNILDLPSLKSLCYDIKPNIIINSVALTNVDDCETNKKLAQELNVGLVEHLLSISRVLDCHFINFSTDYLFDGEKGPYDELAKPNPINYYGKTKHAADNACIVGHNKSTIIRTNVVYGLSSYKKPNFISWLIDKFENEETINVIESQCCNPTLTDDIAKAVFKIIEKQRYGVYNVAGKDYLNRYEIALKVAEVFGFNKELVNIIAESQLVQKANRPKKGGLITLKSETDLGIKFANLDNGLSTYKIQIMDFKKNSKYNF